MSAQVFGRALALVLCLSVATTSLYKAHKLRIPQRTPQIQIAEDEVYEAIIREILPEFDVEHRTRLVFDDHLIIDSFPPGDLEACQKASTMPVQVADDSFPPHISKVPIVSSPGNDLIRDYLKRRCVDGQLSRSFHTDVPHDFVNYHVLDNDRILPSPGDPRFALEFPGAPGVIGFSHAGFNRDMDEAIVSTSFYCGSLCGIGHRYFLKKVNGVWKVVSRRETWVS